MAASPISKLSKSEQRELLHDLNYLNLAEIKQFCKRQSIPFTIAIETKDGARKTTREDDRKGVILDRIRHFLRTGKVPQETRFPAAVVCFDPLPHELTPDDRLLYGQYDKTSRAMIQLLKELTAGQFRNGAIARILARKFWSMGIAPTFGEFAAAWLEETRAHTGPNPEWAFLSDRASKGAVPDWKKLRAAKASKVMKVLGTLPTSR
jgi:hypothetical protein